MGTSSDPEGLFLMSDAPSALFVLFLEVLYSLRLFLSGYVNKTTGSVFSFRAKPTSSYLSRG